MPMPCALHPKATIFPDIGCGACWWKALPASDRGEAYDAGQRVCVCGVSFNITFRNKMKHFCSTRCRLRIKGSYRKPIAKKSVLCPACRKHFKVNVTNNARRYCSVKCGYKFHNATSQERKREAQRKRDTRDHGASEARHLEDDQRVLSTQALSVSRDETGQSRSLVGVQV